MGRVQIFTGDGYGKTMAALGEALIAAASGKRVVVIQFLKGRGLTDSTFERQLEPEIKIFRFEKSDADFLSLPEDKQREEAQNIRNGICFARKVLTTGQCDLLVLDEVLGLVDCGIVQEQELSEPFATAPRAPIALPPVVSATGSHSHTPYVQSSVWSMIDISAT